MKRLLIISHLFPNHNDPRLGIFVHDQLIALQPFYDIRVLAPVPWFPSLGLFKRWSRHSRLKKHATLHGMIIDYPRRLVLPKGYGQVIMGLCYFFSVYRRCKKLSFDLVHSHGVWPDGFVASLIGLKMNKPVIITSHGADTYRFLANITTRLFVQWGLRHADRVVAVSKAEQTIILKYCAIQDKMVLINNGVNLDKFFPQSLVDTRRSLKLPLDKKIILYVGYLYPVKGVRHLLDAFAELQRTNQDTYLVLVGAGLDWHTLHSQAESLNLLDHVLFAGEKPHDDIPLWMNAADLFCLPSLNEGWPTVLFEALACGKPIVATKVGGVPEAISDERYGLLVEPGQPEELAHALQKALDKNWNSSILMNYARQNSWQAKAQQLAAIYETCIT